MVNCLYTSAKFGITSWLAKDNRCVREQWFQSYPCNETDPTGNIHYLRNHEGCVPFTTRNPLEPGINAVGTGFGGSHEIVYTLQDFSTCTKKAYIKTWMDWQNCMDSGAYTCAQHVPPQIANSKNPNGDVCSLVGTYIDSKNKYQLVNALHSQPHIKIGMDFGDATTSPNDPGPFMGHHANTDRSNMIWQQATTELKDNYWGFPKTPTDLTAVGQSVVTQSGPFSPYDAFNCGTLNNASFPGYNKNQPWLNGTSLDDVVNAGFSFKNLFPCTKDEVKYKIHSK